MKYFLFFAEKTMDLMDTMRDPRKLAAKMYDYSYPSDPQLVQLFNLAEGSKDAAAFQTNFNNLQKYIFKKELGDCEWPACVRACVPWCGVGARFPGPGDRLLAGALT
jgi:hypothetical protein